MGNNKQVNGKKKLEVGVVLCAVGKVVYDNLIQPQLEKIINEIAAKLDKEIKNSKDGKVTIPDLCQPDFPLDVNTVVALLEEKKFKTVTAPLQVKDAKSKYKDCIDNQVVEIPKQGKRVEIGSILKIKYITQDVIDASIAIFEDEEKVKIELKEQKAIARQERIEKRNEKIADIQDKAKETMKHIFKKGEPKDEQE